MTQSICKELHCTTLKKKIISLFLLFHTSTQKDRGKYKYYDIGY